jgi:hypothetical protein
MLQFTPLFKLPSPTAVSRFQRSVGIVLTTLALLAVPTTYAFAQIKITGTVGISGKYMVTGAPVSASTGLLKLSFENNTAGTNLELCAGTTADFSAGSCATVLSDSGGPGFVFLTIIDAAKLSGKILFVRRAVGAADSQFTLIVD